MTKLELFCKQLPKIELHAHLNGSLSETTLKRLGCLDEGISEYQRLTKLLNTTEKTLDECFDLFKVAQNATSNKDSVYLATRSVIDDFQNDNVIYLELRTTPRSENGMTKTQYIESVIKAIQETDSNAIIVKLLLSIDRRHDLETSQECMELFIKMKNEYPNVIKGVDLSGNPKLGSFNTNLFKQALDNGLFVTIHCAEVKNDDEVTEILNFTPHRIGHGTFIHPNYGGSEKIWKLYCQKQIPVECCLTSNVVCGTSRGYKDHHLKEWINNSMPFSLSTDDKGVFCTNLSQEFIYAAESFHLDLQKLWEISYNSINQTFASEVEKNLMRDKLMEWKQKNPL